MTALAYDDTVPPGLLLDLEPVHRALLGDAQVEVDRIEQDAQRTADAVIEQAESDRDAEIERARRRGEASARSHAQDTLARARNDSRAIVLRRQEELRQQLVDLVRAEALQLRRDPRYADVLDRLESVARAQLGDGATIERDPEPGGGIIATQGTRRVDYSLPAIADRALDVIAEEAAKLWT